MSSSMSVSLSVTSSVPSPPDSCQLAAGDILDSRSMDENGLALPFFNWTDHPAPLLFTGLKSSFLKASVACCKSSRNLRLVRVRSREGVRGALVRTVWGGDSRSRASISFARISRISSAVLSLKSSRMNPINILRRSAGGYFSDRWSRTTLKGSELGSREPSGLLYTSAWVLVVSVAAAAYVFRFLVGGSGEAVGVARLIPRFRVGLRSEPSMADC